MNISTKLLKAAAGQGGGAGLDIDEVFSTFVYDGSSSGQTITNNIDLSGEGGLVWTKHRNGTSQHALFDTERGVLKGLASSSTSAEADETGSVTAFNSNGYTLGTWSGVNYNSYDYVSWTFRNSPMFQCLKYSGNGVAGRTVSHNLGSVPGMIIVKRTDAGNYWAVWHRKLNGGTNSGQYWIRLDSTDAETTNSGMWNNTEPTATEFTVGGSGTTNTGTYVAYLFAHHANDGSETGFGPDGDSPVISCGSYTGNGSASGPSINLGFQPQFLMIKRASGTNGWNVFDTMRGWTNNAGYVDNTIAWNTSDQEGTGYYWHNPTSTGFDIAASNDNVNANGDTYIYLAVRRGSLFPPEDATKVFAVAARTGASGNQGAYRSGFPVDMAFHKVVTSSANPYEIGSRLTQGRSMNTTDNSAEVTQSDQQYDFMDGWNNETSSSSTKYAWMWKRAPSYFDVVAYTGNITSGHTINHNLGVVPEMMWVKRRTSTDAWKVYHSTLGNTKYLHLNETIAAATDSSIWNDTSPTASIFTLGDSNDVNGNGESYIAYLFASSDVSKVGSYTGNGASDRVIDCGFSNGARFVLIKDVDTSGTNWQVFDTTRGLTSTKAELLRLNLTNAQIPNGSPTQDYHNLIEPDSSGFKLNNTSALQVNASGVNYIFYAIA
tara:strand:- start:144 stop:2123 length:1980 start_codon:yes stop_codon:yes gene_type:complete